MPSPVRSVGLALSLALEVLAGAACQSGAAPRDSGLGVHTGGDITLDRPTLRRGDDGHFTMQAAFTWRQDCGKEKVPCWFKDGERHGGPDVFGVSISHEIDILDATLTLISDCGHREVHKEHESGPTGVAFIVQDRSGAPTEGCQGSPVREYNWNAGVVETVFDFRGPCEAEELLGVDSTIGHSWGTAQKTPTVKVTPSQILVSWEEGLPEDYFTAVPTGEGIYNCSGSPEE